MSLALAVKHASLLAFGSRLGCRLASGDFDLLAVFVAARIVKDRAVGALLPDLHDVKIVVLWVAAISELEPVADGDARRQDDLMRIAGIVDDHAPAHGQFAGSRGR